MGKYSIIYADPPWIMKYPKGLGKGTRSFSVPYQQMTDAEIMALPIKDIAADDSILFLWCVDSRIPIVAELMRCWGFTFKTTGFVWNKVTKDGKSVNANMGVYTRKSCKFLFIGTRGKMLAKLHTQNQYVPAVKGRHSQKPASIRDMIVRMCGDLPRVELFARQRVGGWDAWGNEVESDINLQA